ncbi:MAG TPA: hypothetical protein VFQ44_05370 [Streptosporangiaceae bacterium]|nr:hypothetical protein [Streptosporangiaceae bacterium]
MAPGARLAGLRDIPDLLPGRSETVELSPLSQGEIDQSADGFIDAVFQHGADLRIPRSDLRRDDYLACVLRGGYPEAVRRSDHGRRGRFFESCISDVINRDVRQLTDIERTGDRRRLANLISASTSTLVNPRAWPAGCRYRPTVRRYLDLLDLAFITCRVPAWSGNLTRRAVATPKLLVNTGNRPCHSATGSACGRSQRSGLCRRKPESSARALISGARRRIRLPSRSAVPLSGSHRTQLMIAIAPRPPPDRDRAAEMPGPSSKSPPHAYGVKVLDDAADLAAHVLDRLADQRKQRLKPRLRWRAFIERP